jgi:16S rRNA (cytidine1402-2'-O)-methyltransferase
MMRSGRRRREDRRGGPAPRPEDPTGGAPSGAAPAGKARGTLFVVGTPIGNMDDLSHRAVETLRRSALIACEDTRVTRALLQRHAITTPVVSCHKFNETARVARILEVLAAGRDVALVSDGGTPAVSDPGAVIVRAVREAGGRAVPIPGPSAVTALWSISGFPAGPFTVVGFLPQRRGERRRTLDGLRSETRPLVFFESPHRILGMLADAAEILGDRVACLGREMTKLHEEYPVASLKTLHATFAAGTIRGEFALVVAGAAPGGATSGAPPDGAGCAPGEAAGNRPEAGLDAAAAEVSRLVTGGTGRGAALRQVARATGLPRRAIYARLVRDRQSARRRDAAGEEE